MPHDPVAKKTWKWTAYISNEFVQALCRFTEATERNQLELFVIGFQN